MTPDPLRISIITSTLNSVSAFVRTAESIRRQTHSSVQWIVVDGGSTDGTVDQIRQSGCVVSHWLSEPDTGIYDAWNKACRFIDGDWVLFLGAGDVLTSPDTLSRVASELASMAPSILIAYGNVVQKVEGMEIYRYGMVDLECWELHRPALPAHQGIFHRSHLLRQSMPFDASYQVVADTKMLVTVIRRTVTQYMNIDVTDMEPGGVSSNPRNAVRVMREFLRLETDLGYRIPRGRRLWYVTRTYVKSFLYSLAGADAVSGVARVKQRFVKHRL